MDLKPIKLDNFDLKKVKIQNDFVECEFNEKRTIDGVSHTLVHTLKAKYIPHPDLLYSRDKLKDVLIKSHHHHEVYNEAIEYLKGEQKEKVEKAFLDICNKIEVTGVSISGDEQLKGAVVTGKIESHNGSKCAVNSPRIVFSSDKIGNEKDVEKIVELLTIETYKYLFEGKRAQTSLFDTDQQDEDFEGTTKKVKNENEVFNPLQ